MARCTLPELPCDYAAPEPHISGKIMQLHHDKHHQARVTAANTALDQLGEAREPGSSAAIDKPEKDLAFNLGDHADHLCCLDVKTDYANAVRNVVDWGNVADRFENARTRHPITL